MPTHELAAALIAVGEGRGFFVTAPDTADALVVTAAHCLPALPTAHAAVDFQERTYAALLGALDQGKRSVWAECLFVDPVADIAVLGSPDGQAIPDEADAFEELVGETAFEIGETEDDGSAWWPTLDGRWIHCALRAMPGGPLFTEEMADAIPGGVSGSPIVSADGKALGVVATNRGPHPRLTSHLPGWLVPRATENGDDYPIRTGEVLRLCGGVNRTTMWKWQRERGFPQPIAKPGPRLNLYSRAEVLDWLDRRNR